MNRHERMDDDAATARLAIESALQGVWTAMPGEIQKVDFDKMTVEVQPTIQGVLADKTGARKHVDLPLLVDVPIVYPQGGGFVLTFPIKEKDECLVVFADRCIDAWWQNGGVQAQIEFRRHDLSDGFAIVGVRSQPRVLDPPADKENAQLRTDDAKAHVTLKPDYTITAVNPEAFVEMSPDGAATVDANKEIKLRAPKIRICGEVEIEGRDGGDTTVKVTGTVKSTGDQTAGGISQMQHKHECPHGGQTSGPK